MMRRVAFSSLERPGPARSAVLDLYAKAASSWRDSPSAISDGLRGLRRLHSSERRAVSEAVFGLIRGRRRFAFALGRPLGTEGGAELLDAWLARETTDDELDERIAKIASPIERLGVKHSYPDWIVARVLADHDEARAESLLSAMNDRAPLTVRCNRLKNTRDELIAALKEEGIDARAMAIAPDAVELITHTNVYGLAAFRAGRLELQDAASQIVAELCAPPPRGVVFDACAGAGGKTLALGALLENQGRLFAYDVSSKKLEELRVRAKRAGLTNVRVVPVPEAVDSADRVLVDAPCSGLGVFRRNPEARWRLDRDAVDALPSEQLAIVSRYAAFVAPGGRLIYATCTISRAENDEVIERFLSTHAEFSVMSAKEILGSERAAQIGDGTALRCDPVTHGTDGFFAIALRRRRP